VGDAEFKCRISDAAAASVDAVFVCFVVIVAESKGRMDQANEFDSDFHFQRNANWIPTALTDMPHKERTCVR
jgi:hypothetical protein